MTPYREFTSFTSSLDFGLPQSWIHSDTCDSTMMGITPACSMGAAVTFDWLLEEG